MQIVKIKDLNEHDLVIKWRITYDCNYKCSYCYQDKHCNKTLPYFNYFEVADKIKKLISRTHFKTVELMLIGGECSLLPLSKIISRIDNLTTLHLTTNFSRTADYYNRLKAYVKNLELCLSFHHEYTTPEAFIRKARMLNKQINIFIEMVQNKDSEKDNEKLIELCHEYGFSYIIDMDRRENQNNGTILLSCNEPRVKVTFDNGEERIYTNKNDLYFDKDINAYKNKYIPIKGLTCSQMYDYIYIKGNEIFSMCDASRTALDDWKPVKTICKANGCTLCGRINIGL